ncbi:MAG: AAA family ATPase [Prevotella sp.]|nr:AAA family ATPase [Prevotella sp.]
MRTQQKKFEEIFGSLWIGKHPTELMGRYHVMHLDFSRIGGSIDELEKKFDEYLSTLLMLLSGNMLTTHSWHSQQQCQDAIL